MKNDVQSLPAYSEFVDEIRKLIMLEIDSAIRNRFGTDPKEFEHDAFMVACNERNRIALMFDLPTVPWGDLK